MKSLVIYASRFGNTEKVAEAIADGLRTHGPTDVLSVDEAPDPVPDGVDLVVVGGPTEGHSMSPPLKEYVEGLGPDALHGAAWAAFDTRFDKPRWLTGSAGVHVSRQLRGANGEPLAPEQSFFVTGGANEKKGKEPHLVQGELERATQWGASLAARP